MKNDFMELCLRRQSCRNFADKPVEHEKLAYCLDAARLAPSACNSQPWSFAAIETPEIVSQIALCGQQLESNAFLSGAKAFFVIIEEYAKLMPKIRSLVDSRYFAKSDLGAAAAYICLAAESVELGTCMIGIYDRSRISGILNLPAEKNIAALIAAGYPADKEVRPKNRKTLESLTKFF